jgi:tetratricopeptide (TPR) repeat protein
MKSYSGCDAISFPIASGRTCLLLFASALLFSAVTVSGPSHAAVSLAGMARIEATDAPTQDDTLTLFRGYMSLGLLPEAASLLERRVRTGTFPVAAAGALFDALAEAQARFDSPEALIAVCETALRSGVRTPRVLYLYGTGLRRAPGHAGEASAVLAQVGPESPNHFLALYALGQIAAERGDRAAAETLFRRVEQGVGESGGDAYLARRAARSRAEILLAAGRGAESGPVFQSLMRVGKEPLDRIGLAASGDDPVPALERIPAETVAGLPLMERTRFLLLLGGLAREGGRYGIATERLAQAEKELQEAISSAPPFSLEPPDRFGIVESLRIQVQRLQSLLQGTSPAGSLPEEDVRAEAVELLTGLLFADWTVSRAAAVTRTEGVRFLTSDEVRRVLRRIEYVVLDGVEVDRMVEEMSATLDTLQNLGHPIQRYRSLARLEKRQKEIQRIRDRILERRTATESGVESVRDGDGSLLLRDLGQFIVELGSIRSAAAELREFTRAHFDIFRKKMEPFRETGEPGRQGIRDAYADAGRLTEKLLPPMKTFEERERIATWERRKPQWIALRAKIRRQLADALIGESRRLRQDPGEEAQQKSFAALREVVSLLSGDRLAPEDAADVAVQSGSLLAEGRGRWEEYPGRSAGEGEKEMISRILPLLPAESSSGPRSEESLYLQAALRLAVKDPRAGSVAREFLEKYPSSRLAAEIAVRLGHEALLAGNAAGAVPLYGVASGGDPEASAVGRYMLAWLRFRSGDAGDAVRELAPVLSDPSYACVDPSPFERAILSLSVRAWKEIPPERLEAYPPVRARTCGGKALLVTLWEADEKEGEASRAAAVGDIASRQFPSEEGAAAIESRTVEALLRAGREREALDRALGLREKYGPGSDWSRSQTPLVRQRTAVEMAAVLRNLSERMFDEGIRSGERSAMSSAAAAMGEYFAWKGGSGSPEDETLQLKWGIALLRSGDRKSGVGILKSLAGKQPGDATGERAALLYAEAMVAGYERKEETAQGAEEASLFLLKEYPSGKAVSIALRASSSLLSDREYGPAKRVAEGVEKNRFATGASVPQARLIQAEAAVFEGDLAKAGAKAAAVMADPASGADPGAAQRARDLYLLSSLKEIDGKISVGDTKGAAAMLDELSLRFPEAPEAPTYLLRAMRLHALGGDPEMATRSGFRFLRDYPRREEAMEVASVVGPLLEERKEFARAGELYDNVALLFPKNDVSRQFLFHAAGLAESHGSPDIAARRFSVYAARYPVPVWMWTYATLYVGLAAGQRGDSKTSLRLLEEGLRKVDAGGNEEFPREVAELAGRAHIAVGENWAEQFRKTRLVVPLEKSLAIKDRFFHLALGDFAKAERGGPLELSLLSSRLSGDLFLEYGKEILGSQRPKGLTGSDREGYEEALKSRARTFFERSVDWYTGALERLEKEGGTPDLAMPLRKQLEVAQALLGSTMAAKEGKVQ